MHPDARGRGLGGPLLDEALAATDRPVCAWSHGDHPAAAALAAPHGFERVRELWVMRRPMAEPAAAVRRPPDVVRGYRDSDADEVLRVNAAAFAHHPEQGSMDAANLAERMAEPWFDPAGLLVADGRPAARLPLDQAALRRLGEVYVVGDRPGRAGQRPRQAADPRRPAAPRRQGVAEVLLYVESDNAPAIAVYRAIGFRHADRTRT